MLLFQTALARTDWVNWVFVKDTTTGTVSIYVDGVLAQSVSGSGMATINAIGGSGRPTGTTIYMERKYRRSCYI